MKPVLTLATCLGLFVQSGTSPQTGPTRICVVDDAEHGVPSEILRIDRSDKPLKVCVTDRQGCFGMPVQCESGERILARPLSPLHYAGFLECPPGTDLKIRATRNDHWNNLKTNAEQAQKTEQYATAAAIYSEIARRAEAFNSKMARWMTGLAHEMFRIFLGLLRSPHTGTGLSDPPASQVCALSLVEDQGGFGLSAETDDSEFRSNLLEYQRRSDLPQTGELDSRTLSAAAGPPISNPALSELPRPALCTFGVTVAVSGVDGDRAPNPAASEVRVYENGVLRELSTFEPDHRPAQVALVVDSSMVARTALRLEMHGAIAKLLENMPKGCTYSLWTTGDRPRKVLEYTDDPTAAPEAVLHLAPQGGNTLLDTLMEASDDLAQQQSERPAIVVITGSAQEMSHHDPRSVVDRIMKRGGSPIAFVAVRFDDAQASHQSLPKYDIVLTSLAEATAGLYLTNPGSKGLSAQLESIGRYLSGLYYLEYRSSAQFYRRTIRVEASGPGVRFQPGLAFARRASP